MGSVVQHSKFDGGIAHYQGGETVPQRIAPDACLGGRSTGARTALRVDPPRIVRREFY
jgi:hypothetical protein